MIESDLEDTHLCIKCSTTIVGLENYISHRKTSCGNLGTSNSRCADAESSRVTVSKITSTNAGTQSCRASAEPHEDPGPSTAMIPSTTNTNLEHNYDSFVFPVTASTFAKPSEHGAKTTKALSEAYDLTYELGADVFFNSLQLQSVQATGHSTSGKTSGSQHHQKHSGQGEDGWMNTASSSTVSVHNNTESLMKAVSVISGAKKPYDEVFKPIPYEQESPEASEDEPELADEVEEVEEEMEVDVDDDEDFDPMQEASESGGKWKLPLLRHAPPTSHTGGKWRPEHRPMVTHTHTQLARYSPNWSDPGDDADTEGGPHPPAGYTKGKWVPGTKMQRLEYKEEVELLTKVADENYWCNICCRKLKNRFIYENHLKTGYHIKRADMEIQLEKASLDNLEHEIICKSFASGHQERDQKLEPPIPIAKEVPKRRKRRHTQIKCSLCKHVLPRHLIGKHLISHYHYRRMQNHPHPERSLRMVLDNIHAIVRQSPFQCLPCSFYANSEELFLRHWNSREHVDFTEGPGKFYCHFCNFDCEDNHQMRQHLLGIDHKEVILVINRSVPICISKRISIPCVLCCQQFRYNAELRLHMRTYHPNDELGGTASNAYQQCFRCPSCDEICRSKVALQRHEKNKHSILKYYCSVCKLEFGTACQARRHRKTIVHKNKSLSEHKSRSTSTKKKFQSNELDPTAVFKHIAEKPVNKSSKKENAAFKGSVPSCDNFEERKKMKPKTKLNQTVYACESTRLSHQCMACGQNFVSSQALGRHSRVCSPFTSETHPTTTETIMMSGKKVWTCEDCNFSVCFEADLIYHRLHHIHGTLSTKELIDCPLCDKRFRKHSLRCHLRQHTDEKVYECEICKLRFARPHNLKDHMQRMHLARKDAERYLADNKKNDRKNPASKYSCHICEKIYKSKYALKIHNKTVHEKAEREHMCYHEGCRYKAISNAILNVHLASHSQENLKCDQPQCKYVGKSLLHLKRHNAKHLDLAQPHFCDSCNFKARSRTHLQRHQQCHTGQKPYKCFYCDFRCQSWDNLRKHVLKTNRHPGKYIFECSLCKLGYGQQQQEETLLDPNETLVVFKTNFYQNFYDHLCNQHPNTNYRPTLQEYICSTWAVHPPETN